MGFCVFNELKDNASSQSMVTNAYASEFSYFPPHSVPLAFLRQTGGMPLGR
jgi:hypothetical protein